MELILGCQFLDSLSGNHCAEYRTCRERLVEYETSCGYDKRVGGCKSNELCRRSIVRLMGSVLTTNCTCGLIVSSTSTRTIGGGYQGDRQRCLDDMQRIQQHNVCRGCSVNNDYCCLVFWSNINTRLVSLMTSFLQVVRGQ